VLVCEELTSIFGACSRWIGCLGAPDSRGLFAMEIAALLGLRVVVGLTTSLR
jgi:hypothetical protein